MNTRNANSFTTNLAAGLVALTFAGAAVAQADGSDQKDADRKQVTQNADEKSSTGTDAGMRLALWPSDRKAPSDAELEKRRKATKKGDGPLSEARPERPPSDQAEPGDGLSPDQRAAFESMLDSPGAELTAARTSGGLEFRLTGHGGSQGEHFGGILVGLEDRQCFHAEGLPPMLCGGAVLAIGIAAPGMTVHVSQDQLPGIPFYAQGVLAGPEAVFSSQVIRIDEDMGASHEGQ